uniref:Uncharacterized protein n=1 Tax=Romanomermis culicivorax TaxID=13658 RepID=A0A915JYR7_ROMCU
MFRNHIVVDLANKPKPLVQNPKKTKQQLEEEDEQYALIDKMECGTVIDPATRREYEALEFLKVDDKGVKQIVGDGPMPGAEHRNDIALGTLITQAPHGLGNKTMEYMYNPFNIMPIIFEETRTKRPVMGNNITIDKR